MKRFLFSLAMCFSLMCVCPQTISAAPNNNGNGKEVTVTYDKSRNLTIVVVKDNGKIESVTVRDAKGNIVYTDYSRH